MEKKHLKMKKNAKIFIVAIVAVVVIISLFFAFNKQTPSNDNDAVNTSTPEITETIPTENFDFASYKEINPEYLGELSFDSGLVVEQAVQTTDNEKYLNYAWNLEQSSHGSVYLDYRNKLEDKNLIFYGHYVYADESLIFVPLHELTNRKTMKQIKISHYD